MTLIRKSQIILTNIYKIPWWFKEAGCKTGKILSLKSHHNSWRLVKVQSRKMHDSGLPLCPQIFMQLPPRFCFLVDQCTLGPRMMKVPSDLRILACAHARLFLLSLPVPY
jgi:hypothetical protein